MTDLIPRDAAMSLPPYDSDGEPSGTFDHKVFVKLDALRALPAIDPAAIREAALEACTIIDAAAKEGHENPLDLILHLLTAVEPARRALAMIGEKK